MAGIMALSLMACGQSSASAQTEGSTAEDKTQVETADKETEKAEEVQEGSSGEPIELTMYFPVSVCQILSSVIIKQKGAIMEKALNK